jgi:hypothetical protein
LDGFVGTLLGSFGEVGVDGLDGFVGTVLGSFGVVGVDGPGVGVSGGFYAVAPP